LSNDYDVILYHIGTIQFTKKFIIFNILYILKFVFNLIFVQCLIEDLNCKLIFSYKICRILNKIASKIIRQIKLNKGLYYLHHFHYIP